MSGPVSERRRVRSLRAMIRFDDGLENRPAGVDLTPLRRFVRRLKRERCFRQRTFDVTLVDDAAIAALNAQFRRKRRPTDVLSFPFEGEAAGAPGFEGFAGDVVISLETARRNAAAEHHSLSTELHQLVLHGALHLAGYDHETDHGEMNELELSLRQSFGIEGRRESEHHRLRPQRKTASSQRVRSAARKRRRHGNR